MCGRVGYSRLEVMMPRTFAFPRGTAKIMDSLAAADGIEECCRQDNVYLSQADFAALRFAWSGPVSSDHVSRWCLSHSETRQLLEGWVAGVGYRGEILA